MKLLITLTIMITLTGCDTLLTKPTHTTILVETLKSVCGAGGVSVESINRSNEPSEESSFKFNCIIDKGVGQDD